MHFVGAVKLAAVSAWVALEVLAVLGVVWTGSALDNVFFYATFGLPLIIGFLIGRWRALLLVTVPGFIWLLAGLLEGSHIQFLAIIGVHVEPAILYGPFLALGILLHKLHGRAACAPRWPISVHPGA
ncbi:MAG: hypothetical protein M3Z33_07100 [Actinomycetota bacterium]|nr:hypothetical protein [Actinomycetota bacterium]